MCVFYSFLIDLAGFMEPVEEPGEVRHTLIAVAQGIPEMQLGARFLQPELDLATREVVFESGPSFSKAFSKVQPCLTAGSGPTAAAYQALVRSQRRKPLSETLYETNRFLFQRFGTPDAFLGFVQGEWRVARMEAIFSCLNDRGVQRLSGAHSLAADILPQLLDFASIHRHDPILRRSPFAVPFQSWAESIPFDEFADVFSEPSSRTQAWQGERRNFFHDLTAEVEMLDSEEVRL